MLLALTVGFKSIRWILMRFKFSWSDYYGWTTLNISDIQIGKKFRKLVWGVSTAPEVLKSTLKSIIWFLMRDCLKPRSFELKLWTLSQWSNFCLQAWGIIVQIKCEGTQQRQDQGTAWSRMVLYHSYRSWKLTRSRSISVILGECL